ncbi:MAG TPA: helix-turn-helix domain-containing protein [Opitutaceae bacterium]|nr:helix-turn-helix domain-containing protein [Opitutaceae bacterium]
MSTTGIAQLELDGMVNGSNARGEDRSANFISQRRVEKISKAATSRSETVALETLLTFAEAARVLGISLRQFRRLVDGGKITFVKVSERSPRVRPSELHRFLDASVINYSEVKS